MTITLELIKSTQDRLTKMIADFERQPSFPVGVVFPELNEGEKAVGCIISADGTRKEWVILLPGEFQGNWQAATDWAKSIGGELFDRVEGALLFQTMKIEFKEEWYWTRELHGDAWAWAWVQGFNYGIQYYGRKNYDYRARAVRRLIIQ